MRCSHRPPPSASSRAIVKTERAPRSPAAAHGKALRSVSSSAVGLQNPTAGDTGLPEPLQGLPGDSIEIVRTVSVEPVPCQSFGKEAIGKFGASAPETAASHLFRIPRRGFPSFRREPGGDGHIFQKDTCSKAVVSLNVISGIPQKHSSP